ncbi:MAG: penicillin acylase family protein [Chloroflexi bacterium]|nr:penicillin acylase family protein [Chloroflexota bacterium]
MARILRRILVALAVIVAVLVVAGLILGPLTVRRSFPQMQGEARLTGLGAPVDIYRDQFGIPHIYAETSHDLFYAQGYVHAQDRFWQMDFWRHTGSGRLSEMFGEPLVDTDVFLRTMGWARVARQELELLDPVTLDLLASYAEGVNAYLAEKDGSALSLEYAILGLLTPDYKVEPWEPLHTLTWAKAMAWDLRGNMNEEIDRAILLNTLSREQVEQLYPPYPDDAPVILRPDELAWNGPAAGAQQGGAVAAAAPALQPLLAQLAGRAAGLDRLLGPARVGIGSNNWVVSGELTATGNPILVNDPHLGAQMPSIWYEVGLHCVSKGAQCPYEVTGFSFAGAPGVIIGHNDRIAWGMTNVGPDVMDLYIEKINPQNPLQYEVNGQWVDMQVVNETVQVAGGEAVDLAVRYTRHGPIISDSYGALEDFTANAGIELPAQYALALRWTALEPSNTFPSIWKLNRAQNWEDFRQALSFFNVPSQNMIYADVEGNIGYQTPGMIPVRANGDGLYPVPGWTDEYEWTGYIPYDELPRAFNPAKGYIATANHAVVGPEYPYLISSEWDYGFRARRIVELIESAPAGLDFAWMQHIQGDNKDLNAEALMPILMQIPLDDDRLENARALFNGWDFQYDMDSAPAALFGAFWKNLQMETFADDLPEDMPPEGGSRWMVVMQNAAQDPQNSWWDDKTTPEQVETRDEIFVRAFAAAVDEVEKALGKDPARWKWGDLHTITFTNGSLGESGVAPIEALFNRGPFPVAGGDGIVNAVGWNPTAEDPYAVDWLPSMRMIVDMGDLSASQTVHTTGQSGHAYHPNYTSMVDLWRTIQYHPMLWDRAQVEAAAVDHLRLTP